MPKFPPLPRLSIIVPVGDETAAFEDTLVSVLENRPTGCEIIVPHAGHYDDPFDLKDEVRFVVAGDSFLDLIVASMAETRGRFVHVLAGGLCATPGWTDHALENFEHNDAAAIVPVIRHRATNQIVAAGWQDTGTRLFRPVAASQHTISPQIARTQSGAYLHASFWRRDVLRSLLAAFDTHSNDQLGLDASYAYQFLLREAGWRTVIAQNCDVLINEPSVAGDQPSFARGRRLGAVKQFFGGASARPSKIALLGALLGGIRRPSNFTEAVGQAATGRVTDRLDSRIRGDRVMKCRVQETIVPIVDPSSSRSRRRTA